MGNSGQCQFGDDQTTKLKKRTSIRNPFSCYGCVNSNGGYCGNGSNAGGCNNSNTGNNNELCFDCNELKLDLLQSKPKGRITNNSVMYLQKEEINFMKACASRNLSVVRYYITTGVNINILDEDRTCPLHIAARQGSFFIVEELLKCGASPDITDIAG